MTTFRSEIQAMHDQHKVENKPNEVLLTGSGTPTPPEQEQTQEQRPTDRVCSCGHDRNHYAVSAEPSYSTWGWFCNLFGITARPKSLVFRCRRCQDAFDWSDDPAELDRHV